MAKDDGRVCKGSDHAAPRMTGESSGYDRQGNPWKLEHWKCDLCLETWSIPVDTRGM